MFDKWVANISDYATDLLEHIKSLRGKLTVKVRAESYLVLVYLTDSSSGPLSSSATAWVALWSRRYKHSITETSYS